MRNLVEYTADAYDQLAHLRAAATDTDEVDRVSDQVDLCLTCYDPRTDPQRTMSCGSVIGPGLLPAPHYTALSISVPPLRYYFEVDDIVRPFIMRVVRVEWVLSIASDTP